MLKVDLHTHSTYSGCGTNSVLETLRFAIDKGMEGIAITDHGPKLGKVVPSPFYTRFKNPWEDKIKLFKGMESNFTKDLGKVDTPKKYIKNMDIILLGFHFNKPADLGKESNTNFLIQAIENNPFIDVISHPVDHSYPLDYEVVADACKKHGVALELNNSKLELELISEEDQMELIKACQSVGCKMVVNSDAHVVTELGSDDYIRPIIEKMKIKEDLIINYSLESATDFVESRRERKLKV